MAGESLIDVLARPHGEVESHPGGAPANVARGIARLGGASLLLGALSEDVFGRRLAEALAEDGVELGGLATTSLPSALAIADIDEDGAARYHFHLERTAATILEPDASLAALDRHPAAIYVGGLALGLEPIGSALEALVESAPLDTLVLIDPNCRPGALAEPDVHADRFFRLLGRADIVKVSVEDSAALLPGASAAEAASDLLARGPRCVIVTDGGDDVVVFFADGGSHTVPVPAVTVRDSVGAGDAFCAALLRWLTSRRIGGELAGSAEEVLPAARWAVRVAATTCTRDGARFPSLSELHRDVPAGPT